MENQDNRSQDDKEPDQNPDSQMQNDQPEANNQITSASNATMDHEMKNSEFGGQASSLIDEDAQMETHSASGQILTKKLEDPNVAQIEIKKKQEENEQQQVQETIQVEKSMKDQMAEDQKKKVKAEVIRLFKQIKQGCNKDICYNQNCKCNPYAQENLAKYKQDSQCLQYAVSLRQKTKDPTSMICSSSKSINKDNIDSLSDTELLDVFEDIYQFSCSFVDKSKVEPGCSPIMNSSIDFVTYKKFLKRINDHCNSETSQESFADKLEDLLEVFDHEISRGIETSIDFTQTAIRGFILLLLLPEMDEFNFYPIFEKIIQLFKTCNAQTRNTQVDQLKQFSREMLTHCMPVDYFHQTISKFQSYITIVIIENIFKQDVIMCTIEVLDIFYEANLRRYKKEKVKDSEFYNDALNKDVDLKKQAQIYYKEWQESIQKNKEFDRFSFFTLYCYPWTLNAYRKAELFRIISNQDRHDEIGQALLQNLGSLVNPNQNHNTTLNQIIASSHFTLKIRREHILTDSLNHLVGQNVGASQLKKPLRVQFQNEPAIDEGGVKKEYFQLVFKELFNADYGMFMHNPDTRTYWFNYQTFESNINFELIGTLLGLAPWHGVILDIPIHPMCYKHLLGIPPSMIDLETWQPEVAKSFEYILNYEEDAPLEDILQRTFTMDFENMGEKQTIELVEGGKDKFVTKENRKEFVQLYIEYLFEKLCASQLISFKRGFYKIFNENMLLNLYTPEELEQFVCGSKELNFKQLQRVTKYIQPLHPDHEFVQWFWDIVHNDFDDELRKKMLAFTTGSARVPITGLEEIEFIIGIEGDDEEKLPIAHTCFNQLLLPNYKTKAQMKKKLTQAVQNCEGFGMV